MGNHALASEDEETESTQRELTCLQRKTDTRTKICLIRSKLVLIFLTRLVFLIMVMSSACVIVTSVWLMMDCRKNFASIRPMIPSNSQFCTNMGMPALFACCTVLFTIFGLGCTGRRLTGYALIIIGFVEILQGVTTLTFYKCNTLTNEEVLDAVNKSLLSCRSSSIMPSLPFAYTPFVLGLDRSSAESPMLTIMTQADRDSRDATRIENHLLGVKRSGEKTYRKTTKRGKDSTAYSLSFLRPSKIMHSKRSRAIRTAMTSLHPNQTNLANLQILPKNQKKEHFEVSSTYNNISDCSHNSLFFKDLSLTFRSDEVNKCIQICKSFHTICKRVPDRPSYSLFDTGHVLQKVNVSSKVKYEHKTQSFDSSISDCGIMVSDHVDNLCFYDNKIIMPLSICAPIFYIFLSMCFIYFAYCDRLLKSQSPSVFLKVPYSGTSTSNCTVFFCCKSSASHDKKCFRMFKHKTGSLWSNLPCCSQQNLLSEYSNSTHELLQLRAVASDSNTGSYSVISNLDAHYTVQPTLVDGLLSTGAPHNV